MQDFHPIKGISPYASARFGALILDWLDHLVRFNTPPYHIRDATQEAEEIKLDSNGNDTLSPPAHAIASQ
jgi:hypothetical protein